MTWLTWRQFRVPAVSVFAGLAVIGVLLVVTGIDLRGETDFSDQDFMYSATLLVMYALPVVVGVFWGVPMVTRELETGTHSLVWNQTVTRKRWLANKLVVGALAAMAAAGLLSVAVSWWASPIDALASQDPSRGGMIQRIEPVVFAARAIAPVGYAAFAFVLGVAMGIVLRRTLTAMAVTLVVFAAVMVAIPFLVRPYLLPAAEETVTVTESNFHQIRGNESGLEEITVRHPAGAWVLANETVDRNGTVVSPLPDSLRGCLPSPGQGGSPPRLTSVTGCIAQGFADLGYRQRVTYQPASNFWPLQWIELAFFLALSALLTWFCFRRIRHLS
jgi:hypothetical protein